MPVGEVGLLEQHPLGPALDGDLSPLGVHETSLILRLGNLVFIRHPLDHPSEKAGLLLTLVAREMGLLSPEKI